MKHIYLLFLFLISDFLFAQWIDNQEQIRLREETAYLFNQTDLNGTTDENLLAKEYQARKFKLIFNQQWQEFQSWWPKALSLTTIVLFGRFLKPLAQQVIDWSQSHAAIAQGSAIGISIVSAQFVGQLLNWLTTHGTTMVTEPVARIKKLVLAYYGSEQDMLETALLAYVKSKPMIPAQFHTLIENRVADFQQNPNDEGEKKSLIEYIQNVLLLPTTSKPSNQDLTAMDEALGWYPSATKHNLKHVLVKQMNIFYASDEQVRFAFYFVGPPGTGKTRAARLIAETLAVPIVVINLDEIKEGDLFGNEKQAGIIARNLIISKQQNIIVFFDEVHHFLNNENNYIKSNYETLFKRLTDPANPNYFDLYYKTEISLKAVDIIFSANEVIRDPSLRNRMLEVNFVGYPIWYKKHVTWSEIIPTELNRYNNSDSHLSVDNLTKNHITQINEIVENDTDPGFRTLKQELFKYIADIFLKHRNVFNVSTKDDVPFKNALTGPC